MTQPDIALQLEPTSTSPNRVPGNRWWIYQKERFPLATHIPAIVAFSLSAVGYSSLARNSGSLPGWRQVLVAFAVSFLFFLQLRLADEFKDFEEDCRHRPYRPVPRGTVKLRELAILWGVCVALQFVLVMWLAWRLLPLLAIVWFYFVLMSNEFFVRNWLKRHAITYGVTHMVIMPLIFLFASACDWIVAGYRRPLIGLLWMAAANFFNGVVIEIGRKIRAPTDEEEGVETYSSLWGRGNAVVVWLGAMAATAVMAFVAARIIHFTRVVTPLLAAVILTSAGTSIAFLFQSNSRRAKCIAAMSGLWTLALYLSLGIVPVLLRYYRGRT